MQWLSGLVFQELKRTVYFWGLYLGVVGLLFVLALNPKDPYVLVINPTLSVIFAFWYVQLKHMVPVERVERQVTVGLTIVFSGKLIYYLFAPNLGLTWLEVEDSLWNLAFQMVIFYVVFDSRRGLAMAMGVTAFTIVSGTIHFVPDAQDALVGTFVRAEIRLFAMALLLFIMAHIKDRLVLARTDALTGTLNRMAIAELLELEARNRNGLYAVLLDVDHFKRVNDQFGHAVVDRVLQKVTERLRSTLRKGDHLGRWGGEEFLVLMRTDLLDDVLQAVERLREVIWATPFERVGFVSASFGLAQAMSDDTADALVHRADVALYRAKHLGWNRVELEGERNIEVMA